MCGQCRTFKASKQVRLLRFSMAAGTSEKGFGALLDLDLHELSKPGAVRDFVASAACCTVSERKLCALICAMQVASALKLAHLHFAKAATLTTTTHEVVARAVPQGCSPSGIHPIVMPNVSDAANSASAPDLHLTCTQTSH